MNIAILTRLRLQALPYCLKDLIKEDLHLLNQRKAKRHDLDGEPDVQDPSNDILHVLNSFQTWYNHIRQPKTTSKDVEQIVKETYDMKKLLMQTFPKKSGEFSYFCVVR